jgi:uncharacterized membrane protein required for colicin V production
MTDAVAPRRRGAKLGAWALGSALFPLLYAGIGVLLVLVGQALDSSGIAVSIAYVMFFLGFVVVPACLIVALVLGILALVFDRVLGKILGAIAILVLAVGIVFLIVFLGSPASPLFWTDF